MKFKVVEGVTSQKRNKVGESIVEASSQTRYGIAVDDTPAVPCVHCDAYGAIEEWEYWERKNINTKFLSHQLTHGMISHIKEKLLKNKEYETGAKN